MIAPLRKLAPPQVSAAALIAGFGLTLTEPLALKVAGAGLILLAFFVPFALLPRRRGEAADRPVISPRPPKPTAPAAPDPLDRLTIPPDANLPVSKFVRRAYRCRVHRPSFSETQMRRSNALAAAFKGATISVETYPSPELAQAVARRIKEAHSLRDAIAKSVLREFAVDASNHGVFTAAVDELKLSNDPLRIVTLTTHDQMKYPFLLFKREGEVEIFDMGEDSGRRIIWSPYVSDPSDSHPKLGR